ncbi:MAG: STAS/SEC14 domain-containing protein [Bacteroidetes bacterium QH_1_64_81]|nr:MAG: STAS/SEC14 domain-containing protein [Bacteroidetes bacterium QH_1_64_81]
MPVHCANRPSFRMLIHAPSLLMHKLLDFPDPNLFGVELSDTLTDEDYEVFASTLKDHLEQHTTTRALFVMNDVDDWEPEERWEGLAFDIRHLRDLDKVAIVGDDLWETWLEKVELLFPMSTVQTYAAEDREEAIQWLRGDMEVPGLGPGSVSDPEATAGSEE